MLYATIVVLSNVFCTISMLRSICIAINGWRIETQATLIEIDHDGQQSYVETLQTLPNGVSVNQLLPSDDTVAARLTHPIITTYIDTDNITFER